MTGILISLSFTTLASEVGKRFPPERKAFVDAKTGMTITALTTHPANDLKIYQTHPQWTSDGAHIVFRSDRTGSNQYFAYSEASGEIIQLTQSKVSQICLSRKDKVMYYIRTGQNNAQSVVSLDLGKLLSDSAKNRTLSADGFERTIASFPSGKQNHGGLSLDADETQIYLGIRESDTQFALQGIDLSTGAVNTLIDLPWQIGHIQANPWKPGEILYCHETGGDAPQRMWLINADGSNNRPLYEEAPTEWVTHEVWGDEDHVFFNLSGGKGPTIPTDPRRLKPHGIASINVRTKAVMLHDQVPIESYWHCAVTSDLKKAIGDTHDGDLYLIDLINGGRTLLTADHLPKGGPAHPHQNFSPDGRRVLFGSALFGNPDLMTLELP